MILRTISQLLTALLLLLIPAIATAQTPSSPAPVSSDQLLKPQQLEALVSPIALIAQEVQTVMPQAVTRDRDGYLRVLYDKLGVTFQTYDHWVAAGARVPDGFGTQH